MIDWLASHMVFLQVGWIVVWLSDWSVVGLIGWIAILLFDLLHGLLYGWFSGRLIFAWMAYWSATRLTDWSYSWLDSQNSYTSASWLTT